jgi:hypothetical protein
MTHRAITDEDLGELVERVREATGALMQATSAAMSLS